MKLKYVLILLLQGALILTASAQDIEKVKKEKDVKEVENEKSKDLLKVKAYSYKIEYEMPVSDTAVAPIVDDRTYYKLDVSALDLYFPEVLVEGTDKVKRIDYYGLVPIILNLIQDQETKIKDLEERIENLESK